jgi:hypothetical protein
MIHEVCKKILIFSRFAIREKRDFDLP